MASKQRYLQKAIQQDAFKAEKMAFISGPRQVGKTTLAKTFLTSPGNYFSYDAEEFRRAWNRDAATAISVRSSGTVVLDEIHKDRTWKRKLKGIFDTMDAQVPLGHAQGRFDMIVTGSARLDLFRRKSDSLMGRYYPYRLHPFTVAESISSPMPDALFEEQAHLHHRIEDLIQLSGFPEPLFAGNAHQAARWSRLRLERLVQEDIRDIVNVSDLRAFQVFVELLPERVGSQFSLNSLKEDVGKAYATVRSWYHVLEALYFCFSIKPYSRKITRSLRSEPRIYLYDFLRIRKEQMPKRLENLTALHLLKACQYWTDTAQGEFALHYVRDKNKREVDFLVVRDGLPWMLVECKSGQKDPSANLKYFAGVLKPKIVVQLVTDDYEKFFPAYQTRVMSYEKFFSHLV